MQQTFVRLPFLFLPFRVLQKRTGLGQGVASRPSQGVTAEDDMLTKYQMIKFIDFCEVWFLPESAARVAAIVGDHRCHTPRH
ncbi:hypothetical protein TNCV_2606721 [Trichonephila clavipes]|uniref:Uncharacterized protein n=1 Tax=Trichonephila clavipes TaxID=2585209 RepID=A0A8X6RYY0_TRICX|nr:hypothetical protein TNCV_2606721 [Trichonephila clavipes]